MLANYDIFKDEDNGCYQIRSKTSIFAIVFDEEISEAIFLRIVELSSQEKRFNLQKIRKDLSGTFEEDKVLSVLNNLREVGLIPDDTNISTREEFSEFRNIRDASLAIIGTGGLTKALKLVCETEKFKTLSVVEYTIKNFEDKILQIFNEHDFVIVDANQWSPYHLEIINETAVKQNKPWLYISGINESNIEIGPLFYGKETGCYNCLISRIKSNHAHPQYLTSYENYLRELKRPSASNDLCHDSIVYSLIANFAIYEAIKFIEGWALPITWQSIVKINLYSYESSIHTLLKKPLCEVCKPNIKYNPAPWLDKITLK
ncbi:MAG: TOMM precursor leader peptide-binding protein [Parabacteroides merdae]